MKEGNASQAVKAIACLGCGGKWESNSERDLHTWLKHAYGLTLEPYFMQVTLATKKTLKAKSMRIPVLLLHEIFGQLYDAGPDRWRKSVLGPSGNQGSVFIDICV